MKHGAKRGYQRRDLSDYGKLRQEMVLLHTGNELMTQIRQGNDSGHQNKFIHKQ